jgi:hypothetical protein
MDLSRISEILRMLRPRQEKVIRLYFGLGCQRPHSVLEIAEAFAVSSQVIAGILGAAESRLARCECTHSMAVLAWMDRASGESRRQGWRNGKAVSAMTFVRRRINHRPCGG